MPLAASLLALAWFLTAFALRIVIQVRRHHDTGLRADAGPRLTRSWWARLAFVASIGAVVAGPVLAALGVSGTTTVLDRTTVAWTGTAVAVTGIALTFWAQLAMGASWRIGVDESERTALVTSGPFAVVRNPIFTAMAVTGVGLTLMAPTALGLAGVAGLIGSLELQVRWVEEPHLLRSHGAAYRAYMRRTGRFLPRLVPPRT
jgi:protein-S-isoprenylcysteine O-methyltransferase Ste14